MTRTPPDAGDDPRNTDAESIDEPTTDVGDATTTAISGSNYKVLGELDEATAAGVLGRNLATSGQAMGVTGVTNSTAVGAAGVYGVNAAGGPGIRSEGYVDVTETGASVYHAVSQSIPRLDRTPVQFNAEVADDRGEFENSSTPHEFVVDRPGTYHVDSTLEWRTPSADVGLRHEIWVDDEIEGQTLTPTVGNSNQSTSVSKVLRLAAGAAVQIRVFHNDDSGLDLGGGKQYTYATFTRMG